MLCADEMDTSSSEAAADEGPLDLECFEPLSAVTKLLAEGEWGRPSEGIVLLTVRYFRGSITCYIVIRVCIFIVIVFKKQNSQKHTYRNIVGRIEQQLPLRIVLNKGFVFEHKVLEIDRLDDYMFVLQLTKIEI